MTRHPALQPIHPDVLAQLAGAVTRTFTLVTLVPTRGYEPGTVTAEVGYWNLRRPQQWASLRTTVELDIERHQWRVMTARVQRMHGGAGWLDDLTLDPALLQDLDRGDVHHLLLGASHALHTGEWLAFGLQQALHTQPAVEPA